MTDTPVRIIGMVDRGQPRILPETGSRQHADAALDANRADHHTGGLHANQTISTTLS